MKPAEIKKRVEEAPFSINPLTGLASGDVLMQTGSQLLAYLDETSQKGAFLLARIESLWKIYWGVDYPSGIETWQLIAERFRQIVPDNAYLGHPDTGMVIHMWDIASADEAAEMARKMVDVFREPFEVGGRLFYLYCNVGYLVYPEDTDSVDKRKITQCVTSAVPSEIDGYRHCIKRYSPEVLEILKEREWLDQSIPLALSNNQLRMVYQPRVSLADGKVASAESLMRWTHPERGEVPPSIFIQRSEEIGMIAMLTRFSLDMICRDIAENIDHLPEGFRISVNISRALFDEMGSNLVDMVEAAVEMHRCPYTALELEITETSFLGQSRYDSACKQMLELKRRGVLISIDDFGVGHSSIQCLNYLPVDMIKIDKSFSDGLVENSKSENLIKAMCSIGEALKIDSLAEGVETREQSEILKNIGLGYAQGYYFYRPLEKREFFALVS